MRQLLSITALTLLAFSIASAQKTNDAIAKQIKSLKAEKAITLGYDKGANTSKIMVTGDNFADKEARAAGIQAMNFGMAFFYTGQAISTPPDLINFTFWVLTKKPKFAAAHSWTVTLAKETLNFGDARYVARSGENMEYLNFKISRTDLTKIAAETNVKFKLGTAEFTITPAQLATFKNVLAVSDNH